MIPGRTRIHDPSASRFRGDFEAESRIVSWYLVLRLAHPRSSSLQPWHFGWPPYRDWWGRALASETVPEWTDLGIPPDDVSRLSDIMTPVARQLAETEGRVIAGAAARQLVVELEDAVGMLTADGAGGLPEAVTLARQAIAEADAGLPAASMTQAEVGQSVAEAWLEAQRTDTRDHRIVPMPGLMHQNLGGWVRGKLHTITAPSSTHKTTVMRNVAEHVARIGGVPLFWTFEDSNRDLACRTISSQVAGVTFRDLAMGSAPTFANSELYSAVHDAPREEWCHRMRMIDRGRPKLSEVLSGVRAECARHPVEICLLEYGQLIRPENGPADVGHWRDCSGSIAALAKELDIAIVVALQIDKAATKKAAEDGQPPRTADALGGIGWFQDAYGCLCLATRDARDSRELVIRADKWKHGGACEFVLNVDPARDRLMA